jgi:hypothetical protein
MRLPALKHLVESVKTLADADRVSVLGSSSLLASFPEFGDAGGPVETSYDADLLIEPCDERLAAMVHEAVGEGSLFAQRTGYHADLLRPQIVETLAPGWRDRLVPLPGVDNADALAPVDLLFAKLITGRPKDLDLCRDLLRRGCVTAEALRAVVQAAPLGELELKALSRRLHEVTK